MGDKSPIILTERKKRRIAAAAAKKEMRDRFEWAIGDNEADEVGSLQSDDNKNHNNNNNNTNNNNSNNNNNLKTTKDTEKSPAVDWMSLSTQEIAQTDTQFPSDDPGWWQMWKRNEELEKEMLELMKN